MSRKESKWSFSHAFVSVTPVNVVILSTYFWKYVPQIRMVSTLNSFLVSLLFFILGQHKNWTCIIINCIQTAHTIPVDIIESCKQQLRTICGTVIVLYQKEILSSHLRKKVCKKPPKLSQNEIFYFNFSQQTPHHRHTTAANGFCNNNANN